MVFTSSVRFMELNTADLRIGTLNSFEVFLLPFYCNTRVEKALHSQLLLVSFYSFASFFLCMFTKNATRKS